MTINSRRRFSHILIIFISAVYLLVTAAVLFIVQNYEKGEALEIAKTAADQLIERNLSIHRYFAKELKPAVFNLTGGNLPEDYFDARWMSSTFAVHTMQGDLAKFNAAGYYYKECAINARSPQNEADPFERDFLIRSSKDPSLTEWSGVREIDGKPYYVVLQRGESMEEGCLLCHSDPAKAPKGMVERFGKARSFGRKAGELVSALSVRIPLASAYAQADEQVTRIVISIAAVLAATLLSLFLLTRAYLDRPLNRLREAVTRAEADESLLGTPIATGGGQEIQVVADAFAAMSGRVRDNIQNLEETVADRTAHLEEANRNLTAAADELRAKNLELQDAIAQIKTLKGIIPICASCKKIRDDSGFWDQVEAYVMKHTDAAFSHGICPDCMDKLYPDHDKGGKQG